MSENTHLTLGERNYIEQELIKNTSFKEIALYLGKVLKKLKNIKLKKMELILFY